MLYEKKSKFYDILCDNCKGKKCREYCPKCRRNYEKITSKHYRDSIKFQQRKARSGQTKQPDMINSDQPKQFENPKSSDSVILENGESANGMLKRKSVYSDVLCSDCTNKNISDFCPECKSAYKSAKRKKAYHAKKAKLAANKQTRQTNSDNIHGNEFEASVVETVDPKKLILLLKVIKVLLQI